MRGLTVRWSLTEARVTEAGSGEPGLTEPGSTEPGQQLAERLRAYVAESSHARFTGMPDLGFKTWRMRPGEWFEGCYVFADSASREAFQARFAADAAESPVSRIVGAPPVLIEPCEVVAVAEGETGFAPSAGG